jgi:SnoaL-like protein
VSSTASPDLPARPDPAAVLAELQDRQAILEVLYRYCRAMDRMDHQLGSSVWHPGGTADYGVIFEGTGQGFVDWVMVVHAGLDRHSHQIANVLIEVSGDQAASEAYVTANLRAKPDENGDVVEITSRGRYLDRWSRRDTGWAIDHRIFVDDMTTTRTLTAQEAGDPSGGPGRRDPEDPSYGVFTSVFQ